MLRANVLAMRHLYLSSMYHIVSLIDLSERLGGRPAPRREVRRFDEVDEAIRSWKTLRQLCASMQAA
jgi:hypothetical protein